MSGVPTLSRVQKSPAALWNGRPRKDYRPQNEFGAFRKHFGFETPWAESVPAETPWVDEQPVRRVEHVIVGADGRKRSDGLLGVSDHERRRSHPAPPVLHATAPLLDSTNWLYRIDNEDDDREPRKAQHFWTAFELSLSGHVTISSHRRSNCRHNTRRVTADALCS